MTRLTFGFGIGEDKNGRPLDPADDKVEQVLDEAARLFGGYSLSRITGGWVNDDGRLVREPGMVLEVVTDRLYGSVVPIAREFRETIKTVLGQDAIVLTAQTLDLVEIQ